MPRFFITAEQRSGDLVTFTGASAAHAAGSLRVRAGECLIVVEDGRVEHRVVVETAGRDAVTARVTASRPATGEPGLGLHVLQALPAHGMDEAVEALSLAGAASIRPVLTARSVARPAAGRTAGRVERWRGIAREAAQLAGRARAPEVHPAWPLDDALAALPGGCRILACMVDAGTAVTAVQMQHNASAGIVVGPEGGLAPADLAVLAPARAEAVHLGPRVFPARLAGAVAVTLLLAGNGELAASAPAWDATA